QRTAGAPATRGANRVRTVARPALDDLFRLPPLDIGAHRGEVGGARGARTPDHRPGPSPRADRTYRADQGRRPPDRQGREGRVGGGGVVALWARARRTLRAPAEARGRGR